MNTVGPECSPAVQAALRLMSEKDIPFDLIVVSLFNFLASVPV